ncbi:MAG: energy transducer TonB [Deltaproteobacteria bacterium]|nr:MAG: energy transducer TonB [Deltaproteobacteria bacterium]
MAVTARRRRSRSRDHYRPLGVVAAALAVHAAFLTFVPPPTGGARWARRDRTVATATAVSGPGGSFTVDTSCAGEAVAHLAARAIGCAWRAGGHVRACVSDALRDYRLALIDCSAPDADTVAQIERDATPLLDADSVDAVDLDLVDAFDKMVEEKVEERLDGQVVDIPAPAVERRPDHYDYLAEYDSTVDRQTVRRGAFDERGRASSPPSREPAEAPRAPAAASSEAGGDGALSMRRPGAPGRPAPAASAAATAGFDRVAPDGIGAATRGEVQPRPPWGPAGDGGEGGAGARPGPPGGGPNLTPTPELIERVAGGTMDHLPGVEEGETTALNTRKFKYATFFNRVKRQVAQNWHPEEVYRRRDPTGNIYGVKDRITVLTVSLTRDGALDEVVVSKPSGVDFLDEEAIQAFRLAQPFPNPPTGLVDDGTGRITFRFGFAFEIERGSGWRIFRY